MSNVYSTNPIKIDTAMASGWRGLQTFNPGQWGIRVVSILWAGPSAAGHTYAIVEPTGGQTLWVGDCSVANQDIFENFSEQELQWRDFKVSQISSGVLYISYRA